MAISVTALKSLVRSDEPSLRERKKQRTREALTTAAFDLFTRKGFEATTVEEIADAVEISTRTFFRYFLSKDDVIITAVNEQYTAAFAAFAQRPADEPVLTALRRAMVSQIRSCEAGTAGLPAERFACVVAMLTVTPSLSARTLEFCAARIPELAELVAARMGVSAVADARPTLVAAVALTTIPKVAEELSKRDPAKTSSALMDEALELLEASINYPAASNDPAAVNDPAASTLPAASTVDA
jgi:AcrR family transcriptional regulator